MSWDLEYMQHVMGSRVHAEMLKKGARSCSQMGPTVWAITVYKRNTAARKGVRV